MTESDSGVQRPSLCPRCGAVMDPPIVGPDGRGQGACPDCGLGFSSARFSSRRRGPLGTWWAGWRGRRQLEAHRSQRADVLRQRPFPVYGLDGRWTGRRWAGGWGSSNGRIDHVCLGHGDPYDDDAPLVRVDSRRPSSPADRMTAANAAHQLAEYLWQEGGAEHDVVRPAFTSEEPTASWAEVVLPVDGRPTPFRMLGAGRFWVALGRVGECVVVVEARGVEPARIGLVTVDDVGPYLAGEPMPH